MRLVGARLEKGGKGGWCLGLTRAFLSSSLVEKQMVVVGVCGWMWCYFYLSLIYFK